MPVTLNTTDGVYYGTQNFQLTPLIATYTGTGDYGTEIWIHGDNMYGFAGQLKVNVNGVTYNAYCIDIYTMIYVNNQLLVNGPLPGTTGNFSQFLLNGVDWGKVTYIINTYSPDKVKKGQRDLEAAAIQAAIWYFTSAPYGAYPGGNDPNHPTYYQFLTYNSTYAGYWGTYDGYSTTYGNQILTRAWQIINSAISMQYPSTITIEPGTTRVVNGQSVTLTATVKDQNGNPLPGITVNFTTNKGSLSRTTGTTDANGQITTVLSGVGSNTTANVIASVSGNYGNL